MDVTFFETPAQMREWLERHHGTAGELWVGYYKKDSGRAGITWSESVDEALCFGWIDGIRKRVDDISYTNRFTPRKPRSTWSAVNVARVQQLVADGRMTSAGLRAFEARTESRTGQYSYEQRAERLDDASESAFKANAAAWAFWEGQPASYRRAAVWWVLSAKREETRRRRLEQLITVSAEARRLPQFARDETK